MCGGISKKCDRDESRKKEEDKNTMNSVLHLVCVQCAYGTNYVHTSKVNLTAAMHYRRVRYQQIFQQKRVS